MPTKGYRGMMIGKESWQIDKTMMKAIRSALMSYVALYVLKKGVQCLKQITASDPVRIAPND